MLVRATQRGYFGSLREIGDEFEVADGQKATWFVPVEAVESEDKPAKKKVSKPADDAEVI